MELVVCGKKKNRKTEMLEGRMAEATSKAKLMVVGNEPMLGPDNH